MRKRFFYYLLDLSKHPEGCLLPLWARVVRTILFPLDTFYWKMSKSRGYDIYRDIWIIDNVEYSARSLYLLSHSQNKIFEEKGK